MRPSFDLPANLAVGEVVLIASEACGVRVWLVCERMDRGGVIHSICRGKVIGLPEETAEQLLERAAALCNGQET